MEAAGLGLFMVSAGLFGTLLFAPGLAGRPGAARPLLQRALMGLMMGLTAIGIIYSPWGQQSGAHINPAVTLTFWRLGKVGTWDAVFYVLAQFAGGALGVLLVLALLGAAFADPPVSYVATVPGPDGALRRAARRGGDLLRPDADDPVRHQHAAPDAAAPASSRACLVALYITLEAPLSGMSMNPARTLASALPGSLWQGLWIYFVGPDRRHQSTSRLASVSASDLHLAPRRPLPSTRPRRPGRRNDLLGAG